MAAQLPPHPEAARSPPLATQVVDRLGAHLQLGAELGQGQDTVDKRQGRSVRGAVSDLLGLHDRQVCEEFREPSRAPETGR